MFKMKTFEGGLIFQIQHHFLDLQRFNIYIHSQLFMIDKLLAINVLRAKYIYYN